MPGTVREGRREERERRQTREGVGEGEIESREREEEKGGKKKREEREREKKKKKKNPDYKATPFWCHFLVLGGQGCPSSVQDRAQRPKPRAQ